MQFSDLKRLTEISQYEYTSISSEAANDIVAAQTLETGSQTPDLLLPLEPTLPAIPEACSGADPDFLDLDLAAESDVYIAGQPDLVSDTLASTIEMPTPEEAFTESLTLALPLDAPPTFRPKGASSRHEIAVEIRNVVLTPSVEERTSPLDEAATEALVEPDTDTFNHVDDLPGNVTPVYHATLADRFSSNRAVPATLFGRTCAS